MVTPKNPFDARADWQTALQAGPDCLALDRFSADLTADETRHVACCARCQAERLLWQEFQDSRPGEDDAVVREIAADLQRRRETAPATIAFPIAPAARPRTISVPAWLQLAALLAVTTAVGYGLWDREPALRAPRAGAQVYRSLSIEIVAPSGDVSAAPGVFEWRPIEGVARYDVKVREVDGTDLWSASSAEPFLPVPPGVQLKMQPGKTLLWEVAGITARGDVAARSTIQRFRVVARMPSSGD